MNSSSSSSCPPLWDVFLSFHGKDTRNSFTSHLYTALDQAAIRTYKDDRELEKSQKIPSGLVEAIHNSKASIVVFSNNYARSAWCLDELVEILAFREKKGLLVFPIFYHADPSDIRRQKGSFGEALEIHNTRYSVDKIEEWRAALSEIANISGYHIEKDSNVNESDTIKQILKDVVPLVSTKALYLEEHLVGIDSAVEEIYEKLSMQSSDAVRAVAICGIGGIGKTTIAKAFHNKYYEKFDSSCFVENVKRIVQGPNNLLSLLNQLLAQLLRIKDYSAFDFESGISKLNEIFSSRKVLIVLDDFDELSDSELLRRCNSFCPGSTIIVTARERNLLSRLRIDIYMVNKLGEHESLELFSYHAFGTTIPSEDFRYLSKSFVEYVDGLPLALKVLGSSLHGRDATFWKEKLEKVKKIPVNEIHQVLRLSYDELSDTTVKDIFLDIVFSFVGKEKDEAVWVLESSGFFPNNGIPILLERCLLTVENNKLKMHNLIQDMGWKVIRQESQEADKRKRLVFEENEFEMFEYEERKDKIEGLILDLTWWTQKDMSTNIFEMMPKLRLLEIANAPHDLKISFDNSFQELRYIRWHYCPWKRLPSSFRPPKLILLDMQFSNFEILWKGSLPLVNLKSINVSWSKRLKSIPNFNEVKRLEKLSLRCCWNLLKLHKSFPQLSKLSHLDLGECRNLKRLPQTIGQLDGLRNLDLGGCHILKGLSDSIEQLTGLSELCLRKCYNLTQLPELLGNMKGLKRLDASYTNIEQLPDSICQLSHLYDLDLNYCKKLKDLPEQIGNMKGLRIFEAGHSAIRQLPDSFEDLINLSQLRLGFCINLERLPDQLGKMQCLEMIYAYDTAIEELPDSVTQLTRLKRIDLSGCKKLGEMPGGFWNLTSLTDIRLWQPRRSLESLPDSITNMKGLESLGVTCNIRSCLPLILCLTSLRYLVLRDEGESFSSTKSYSLSNLSKLGHLRLEKCTSTLGSCLPELPLNLESLYVERYESLEQLPDLSTFIYLTILWISECNSLRSLPPLPPHLTNLYIHDCGSIRDTGDHLTTLKYLEYLQISGCSNLIFNAEQSFFRVLKSSDFEGVTENREIPKWFGSKRSGSKIDCVVPQILLPNNSLCMLFCVVYNLITDYEYFRIRAVITNKTHGTTTTHNCRLGLFPKVGVCSGITCRVFPKETYSSGDRLIISFQMEELLNDRYLKVSGKHIKSEKCGIHFMYK